MTNNIIKVSFRIILFTCYSLKEGWISTLTIFSTGEALKIVNWDDVFACLPYPSGRLAINSFDRY